MAGVDRLAEELGNGGRTVAVVESLTGGMLASRLARASGAGDWFRGGIVAYAAPVKHELLAVPPVPVVSREAAIAMAAEGRRLLGADVAVAVTGVGGPGEQDGVPAGTVWLAVVDDDGEQAAEHHFDGGPGEVCDATCDVAVAALLGRLAPSER